MTARTTLGRATVSRVVETRVQMRTSPVGETPAHAWAGARDRVFAEAARRRAAVIPAHYPGSGGATLIENGGGTAAFTVDEWLELPEI